MESKDELIVQFTPNMVFVTKDSPQMKYEETPYYNGKTVDWGQMKLLISEILWLVNHWDVQAHPTIILVVAGGASGEHFDILLQLFPSIERLDLWDPRKGAFSPEVLKYQESGRVKIIEDFMNPETLQREYGDTNRSNMYFISDIRTTVDKDGTAFDALRGKPRHEDIIFEDMLLQQELTVLLNPVSALLKFRVPYAVNYTAHKGKYIDYLRGLVYFQCFEAVGSAEMRLECHKNDNGDWEYTSYDKVEFEQKLAYYNNEVRQSRTKVFLNSINSESEIDDNWLLPSFDSCYVLYVLDKYLRFVGYDNQDTERRYRKTLSLWQWILMSTGSDMENKFTRYRRQQLAERTSKRPELYSEKEEEVCKLRTPEGISEMGYQTLSFEATRSIYEGEPLTFGL